MSTQKWTPDHKRKMVGGVLAAALLFSVVIGAKLNTGQLATQVGGENDDKLDGCYYTAVTSAGTSGLTYCDDTGCYYPDGFWDSNDIYLPFGTYQEGQSGEADSWSHPDYGTHPYIKQYYKQVADEERSAYEISDPETCRDENGNVDEDYDDGGAEGDDGGWDDGDEGDDDGWDGGDEWDGDDQGDGGKPDAKHVENELKNMRNQLKDHTKFNLPDLKNLIYGREFKTPSGKVKKETGRIGMIREQLERDINRNTKLKTMLEDAGLPTVEIDESIAWDEARLDDIYFIEAEVKDLVPRYESDLETVKSLVEAVVPEEATWESLNQVWFEMQKTLDPYWSLRDTIDGVVNHTERTNEILDWTFEYRKATIELSKFGGDVYLNAGLLAELEEVSTEGVEVKNIAAESVDWYKDLKEFADYVWSLEFQENWHEEIEPMRDRQQEFGYWRNDINWTFEDWRCVEEAGDDFDGDFGGDFGDDFGDDFDGDFGGDLEGGFDEGFEDDDFDGGSGFCEMDVWRLLEEVRMSADQGREVEFHIEEIKFMIEAIGQMNELRSMIDTDDPKVENAIDELVKLASEILPTLEEILAHMEAGEFEDAEEKGSGLEETGSKADKWAMTVIDYCDNNPSRCELTPAVDELLYGGPEDFRDRDDFDDYLGEYYIDEELIEKVVNELLAKFADDIANKLLAQLAEAFNETEMNDLIQAMVDEAIEQTMSVVLNYFDALGQEKSKMLVDNSSAVYALVSDIEGLTGVEDDILKVLAQIKEKPVSSTVKDGLVGKLKELYSAIGDNGDTDAILTALKEFVAMNEKELIVSDGYGYYDVAPEDGDWFVEHVLRASAGEGCEAMFKGDTNSDGSKKGTFRPGDPIARNEMLKVGLAASGNCLEAGSGVLYWDEIYIATGNSMGLSIAKGHGVDDRAYWGTPATRQELAWLIYELGASVGKYDLAEANTADYGFPDVDKNSDLAKVAAILKQEEIITGTGEGKFAAESKTNRAEASKVFSQFKMSMEKSLL